VNYPVLTTGLPSSSKRLRAEYFSSIPLSQRRFHLWASRLRSTGKAHLGINNIKFLYIRTFL